MNRRSIPKNKSKKWLIRGAIVAGVALLLFVGLHVFTWWLQRKLEQSVQKQTQGVYQLELHGLTASPFIGSISVDSVHLTPDYSRWDQLQRQNEDVSRSLLDLKAKAVTLSRLNFFKALFRKNVDLGSLSVQQPTMLITIMRQDTTPQHRPLHETVKGFLKNMQVGYIDVEDATLRYRETVKAKEDIFALNGFTLTVDNFMLDSTSFYNTQKAYYTDRIVLKAENALYRIPNDYYILTTDSVTIDTNKRLFTVAMLHFKPTVSPTALSKAKGMAATHMKVSVPSVSVTGIDFSEHSRNNNIKVGHVLIKDLSLSAYKDKKNFKEFGYKPLPHDIAQQIEPLFTIDTIEVKNGYSRYEELADKATETGKIHFSGINGKITNVSNDPERISRKRPAVVQASALVMGKVKLQATVKIPLLDKNGFHTLKGKVAPGSLQIINPILVPTAFARIDKGYVQGIEFEATLNKKTATGTMRALYNNLEAELLSAGTGGKQSFGKKILSKGANKLIIESSNPDKKGGKPRIAEIKVTRKTYRSALTYWKDCLASGLLTSMGLKPIAEQKFN